MGRGGASGGLFDAGTTCYGGAMNDTDLQERLAHLERAVDDLSAARARDGARIDRLERLVQLLREREAGRESDAGGGVFIADERPPHW